MLILVQRLTSEGKTHMARIVIADDDADIRELVVFKLRHGGHEVSPWVTAPQPSRLAPLRSQTWSSST